MRRQSRRPFAPKFDALEDISLLSTVVSGLTPSQVAHTYGLDVTTFTSGGKTVAANGAGQTIAIVDAYHDPNLQSDLNAFDAKFGLPATTLHVFSATSKTDDGWASEEALDVEWVHAIAPGATIDVVEAASSSLADLLSAVNTARNLPGVSVVSMSWGTNEFFGQSQYDSFFTTPAGHTPITFLAATGDTGAWSGASWPASSPNVVAVGGTTLNVTSGGTYSSESAWSGSGGGISQVVSEPSFQRSVQLTGARTTPDVSINANPNTGYAVYFTAPSTGSGSSIQVGGTSASTQVWAGIIAIVNQGRVLGGGTTLNGATQTLPALYSLSSSSFHDITSGSKGYSSSAGYDLTTGLGSPILNRLIPGLVAFSTTSTTTTGTGSGTTTTGTGTGTGTTTTGGGAHRHHSFGGFGGAFDTTPGALNPSSRAIISVPIFAPIPITLPTTPPPATGQNSGSSSSSTSLSSSTSGVLPPQSVNNIPTLPREFAGSGEVSTGSELYDLILEMIVSKMMED